MIINGFRHHRAHKKNRISAVYFIHCYSYCYSILKINQLSGFIASLSHNNPHFFILLRGGRPALWLDPKNRGRKVKAWSFVAYPIVASLERK